MEPKYKRVDSKFISPLGPIIKKEIFNRSIWHAGDVLKANMIASIHESRSLADSAGLALKQVLALSH